MCEQNVILIKGTGGPWQRYVPLKFRLWIRPLK